jgi:hypothetical protein
MKKRTMFVAVAVLVMVAVALPALAIEFKYGGYYHWRWITSDNLTGSNGRPDDNQNYFDQRLRMYFDFVGSENLQVVTKWEVDTLWGNSFDKFSTGGGVGADSINLEMKNVYIDFAVPYTPARAKLGVQGLAFLTGWIVDDDFSSANFTVKLDPVEIKVGYIAGANNDVTSTRDNIDDVFVSIDYSNGPFSGTLLGFYQDGHDAAFEYLTGNLGVPVSNGGPLQFHPTHDNQLFDLGLALAYKQEWFDVFLNYVQNLGSYDDLTLGGRTIDYRGFMVEAGANFNFKPFTFMIGGFLTSGDTNPNDGTDHAFQYPEGRSHYWSEILGLGTLDQNISTSYLNPAKNTNTNQTLDAANKGGFSVADGPSNIWTISAGAAWQALEKTKLTLTYYYVGTEKEVLANVNNGKTSNSIGHEIDFYIDQDIMDKLTLRLVAAYLVADDAYTIFRHDDDAYKAGAVLSWKF